MLIYASTTQEEANHRKASILSESEKDYSQDSNHTYDEFRLLTLTAQICGFETITEYKIYCEKINRILDNREYKLDDHASYEDRNAFFKLRFAEKEEAYWLNFAKKRRLPLDTPITELQEIDKSEQDVTNAGAVTADALKGHIFF